MTSPYLVACLATLRKEFNALGPARDKGSDGWIGDAAHQDEVSDHNPDPAGRVLALDIDSTGPWPYVPFSTLVESLRGDSRLEYIIWNRRIASRSQGWTWRAYSGTSDPHTGHAHFSARHDHTGNTSIATWLEDFMPLTSTDKSDIATIVRTEINKIVALGEQPDGTPTSVVGHAVLVQGIPDGTLDGTPRQDAYAVLTHLGETLVAMQKTIADLDAAVRGGFNPGA